MEEFEDWELVNELQDRDYDFTEDLDDDELIDVLYNRGYSLNTSDRFEARSLTESIFIDELVEGFSELDFEGQRLVLSLIDKLKSV